MSRPNRRPKETRKTGETGGHTGDDHAAVTREKRAAVVDHLRELQGMLRDERTRKLQDLMTLVDQAADDASRAQALEQLCAQCKDVIEVDGQNDSHATEWLLGDGAVQLGTLLQRPELGEAAPQSVAQRVLLLCHTLLAAARAEEENPERLQHTLEHLQPAAPACLRLLNTWLRSPALMACSEDECMALAASTAELAAAAVSGGGLPGGQTPLLELLGGCLQRLEAEPACGGGGGGESLDSSAAAVAVSDVPLHATATKIADLAADIIEVGSPREAAATGWDLAVAHAAVAIARLATCSAGAGCGGSDRPVSSGGGGGSGSTLAAFAASTAAAEALLNYYWKVHDGVVNHFAAGQAMTTPLWFGAAHRDRQQQYLQRYISALYAAMADLEAACTRQQEAEAATGGGHRADGTAADGGSQPSAELLACRMDRVAHLASVVPHMLGSVGTYLRFLWQPWSEVVTSCLERMLDLRRDQPASIASPDRVQQPLLQAIHTLRIAALQILFMATGHGVAALQRPPLPTLLATLPRGLGTGPAGNAHDRQAAAALHARVAAEICRAVAEVAEALESPRPRSPPSPQLLSAAYCATVAVLGCLPEGTGGSVWQHGARQQEAAGGQQEADGAPHAPEAASVQAAESADPANCPLLQELARLILWLLRGGLASRVGVFSSGRGAAALVAALAPPPVAHRNQRQRRRLAAGAAGPICTACGALAALCDVDAKARQSVSAADSSGSWSAVSAAIRQASAHEAAETQQRIQAALQQVDEWLDRQQEAAGSSADAGSSAKSPARPRGRRKQAVSGALPQRTVDSAEAAMRALLLEEEEAAAAAHSKAAKLQPKGKQAAKSSPAADGAGNAAVAADGTAAASAPVEAGAGAEAGAAAKAAGPGPAVPRPVQQWMRCPITQEVMRDPVLCEADGQTYERAAITAWLQQHSMSFVTRAPLQTRTLIPNHTLRSMIQASQQ